MDLQVVSASSSRSLYKVLLWAAMLFSLAWVMVSRRFHRWPSADTDLTQAPRSSSSRSRHRLRDMHRSCFHSSAVESVCDRSFSDKKSWLVCADGGALVYIFIGSILLHDGWLRIIAGSIIGLVGVAYGGFCSFRWITRANTRQRRWSSCLRSSRRRTCVMPSGTVSRFKSLFAPLEGTGRWKEGVE
jgi:hypothetical protein